MWTPPDSVGSALAASALLAVLLPGAAVAQDGPPAAGSTEERFGGEVQVTVVNLDVMVRDRQARPVEGLTAADFRVLQDGAEMPISNFAAFAAGSTAPLGAAGESRSTGEPSRAVAPTRPPIAMVLLVDSANLDPLQRNRVLQRVRVFVRDNLRPPVRMAVAATHPHLEVRQPFTDDPEAVIGALDRLSRESGARFLRDAERGRILEWLEEVGSDRRSWLLEFTELPDVRIAKVQLQARITAWIQEETFALRDSLGLLGETIGLLASLEGRRSILHISSGLSTTPGVGLLHEFEAVFRDPSIFSRVPQVSLVDDYRDLVVDAGRAGVSLYTVEARGLSPLEGFSASDRFAPEARTSAADLDDLQGSLRYLAESTGGLAVVNTNDPTGGLARIADDLESWYSIGYTLASGGNAAVRRLEVELPGHPELEVRARRWHVETSPETRLADAVLGAAAHGPSDNPLSVQLALGAPTPDGRRWVVPVRLTVPLRLLALRPGEGQAIGRLEVCVVVVDDQGRRSEPTRRSVEVTAPAALLEDPGERRVAVELRLAVRDAGHEVAAGVLDRGSGVVSTARVRFDPPASDGRR